MSGTTGGPAFPAIDFIVPQDLSEQHVHRLGAVRGMSMRDYFAAKVMDWAVKQVSVTTINRFERAARDAYAFADAMLAERAK